MDDLGIIQRMNYELMELENRTAPPSELTQPLLFVVGPPRSGTTVVTQFLAYGLKLGYITNIAARFWNAPTLGIRVSESVLGDDPAGDMGQAFFQSTRGRTKHGGGIHEFGFFWKMMCWESPKLHQVAQIQRVLDKPLVMKGIYPARHAQVVRESLGDYVKFIAVERPFKDVIASVMKLYTKSGQEDFWFRGWELPSNKDGLLQSLPSVERTAARIYYWLRYSAAIADFKIYLPNICGASNTALHAIASSIDGIDEYRKIPENWLEYRSHDYDNLDFLTSDRFNTVCERVIKGIV